VAFLRSSNSKVIEKNGMRSGKQHKPYGNCTSSAQSNHGSSPGRASEALNNPRPRDRAPPAQTPLRPGPQTGLHRFSITADASLCLNQVQILVVSIHLAKKTYSPESPLHGQSWRYQSSAISVSGSLFNQRQRRRDPQRRWQPPERTRVLRRKAHSANPDPGTQADTRS